MISISNVIKTEVAALENQVAQLQARIAALGECESETAGAVSALRAAVGKVVSLAPGAVDSLRQTVLDLFNVGCESGVHGNDGNQGDGGQPVVDAPLEVLRPTPQKSEPLLNGQTCEIDPMCHWETAQPDGSHWQLATPLCCQMKDAPLLGQACELASCLENCPVESLQGQAVEVSCWYAGEIKPLKLTHKGDGYQEWTAIDVLPETATSEPVSIDSVAQETEVPDLFELVNLTTSVAYFKRIDDGEIVATYAGFNSKAKAEQWGKWLTVHHSVASAFEIRPSLRLTNFRYEVKLWGLSLKQIERLTECDLTKTPPSNFGDASKRKPEVVAAPKSFQVDPEVVAVMETEAKLEEAAVEEALASIQTPETPAPAYNPNPIGRRGAASNWKALQAAGGLNLKKHGTGINNGAAAVIEKKETEASPAFKIGDSVTIKSARHGENLLGLNGTIKIANPVGCVVDVGGQARWFCSDEIELLQDDFDVEF